MSAEPFLWRDGDRVVVFRPGLADDVAGALREHGVESFHLLSTPRRLADAPGLAEAAEAVHEVAPGRGTARRRPRCLMPRTLSASSPSAAAA